MDPQKRPGAAIAPEFLPLQKSFHMKSRVQCQHCMAFPKDQPIPGQVGNVRKIELLPEGVRYDVRYGPCGPDMTDVAPFGFLDYNLSYRARRNGSFNVHTISGVSHLPFPVK